MKKDINAHLEKKLSKEEKDLIKKTIEGIEGLGLSKGDKAPSFTLRDSHGTPVALEDKLKEGPVVLTFFRGAWCPICTLQLRAYCSHSPYSLLTELRRWGGISILAVSPQRGDASKEFATLDKEKDKEESESGADKEKEKDKEEAAEESGGNYHILVDEKQEVSSLYRVQWETTESYRAFLLEHDKVDLSEENADGR